jgi:hypothetical protein
LRIWGWKKKKNKEEEGFEGCGSVYEREEEERETN